MENRNLPVMLVRLQRSLSWKRTMEISQWIIPMICLFFIWYLLASKSHQPKMLHVWKNAFAEADKVFFLLVMLTFTSVNLFLESLKWKFALREFKSISYAESFGQTMKAMAAGFITPFRSGAILARFMTNENTDRMRIVDVTIRMAIAQFTVTFFMGIGAAAYWLNLYGYQEWLMLDLFVGITALGTFIYFHSHPKKFHFRKTEWNGFRIDLKLILISLIRYTVFTFQYLLLLYFFGAEIGCFSALSLISVTFLVNTLLPSGILGKIGIRELSAVMIIGETTGYLVEASCAAFMIWILNQALPAFIGSLFFLFGNSRMN